MLPLAPKLKVITYHLSFHQYLRYGVPNLVEIQNIIFIRVLNYYYYLCLSPRTFTLIKNDKVHMFLYLRR